MSNSSTPSWLQVRLDTNRADYALLEEVLFACGALSVSLEDAGSQPIFDPGETWDSGVLTALFETPEYDADRVADALHEALPGVRGKLRFEHVQDQDWVALTQAQFPPRRFGERLWVVPSWSAAPADAACVMHLDPGQAFGTGAHPTTALCLTWLDAHVRLDESVLDYGCGSGILAIAALLLGAAYAYGVDIDTQSLETARENAERNGVGNRLWLGSPEHFAHEFGTLKVDRLVANILAAPLCNLASTLAAHHRPGGALALSGILDEQSDRVSSAYQPFYHMDTPVQMAEWVRIDGQRRSRLD